MNMTPEAQKLVNQYLSELQKRSVTALSQVIALFPDRTAQHCPA